MASLQPWRVKCCIYFAERPRRTWDPEQGPWSRQGCWSRDDGPWWTNAWSSRSNAWPWRSSSWFHGSPTRRVWPTPWPERSSPWHATWWIRKRIRVLVMLLVWSNQLPLWVQSELHVRSGSHCTIAADGRGLFPVPVPAWDRIPGYS